MSVLLIAALHVSNVLLVAHFYGANSAREHEARETKATLLAEHASRVFSALDLSLETIADRLPKDERLKQPSIFVQMLLDEHARRLPQVRAIAVLDETGRKLYDSREYPTVPLEFGDRPYFAEQKKWRGVGLYIGDAMIGRYDGEPFFGVSRPLLDSDGNFRGIVLALAESSYFSSFYGTSDLNPGESSVLARNDGTVLVGTSRDQTPHSLIANVLDLLGGQPVSSTTVRPSPSYPLQITVSGPSPAASPAFQSFLLADSSVILVMTLVAGWLTSVLAREARAREIAEMRLRNAIENAPDGFALFDAADRLVLCNHLYRSLYPAAMRDLIVPGVDFAKLVNSDPGLRGKGDIDGAQRAGEQVAQWPTVHHTTEGELVQKLPSGSWVLTRARNTDDHGVVYFHTDITPLKEQEDALRRSEQAERSAREQAEQANLAKSAFLATMSHELRTPLNAVIGFSEIIERQLFGGLDPRYHEYGALIHRSGQHLLAIINDVLDLAKLQSGKTEISREPTHIGEVIADSLRMVANQAAAGDLTLAQRVEQDLPLIQADPIHLRQVLINLLSNAIKFTPKGGNVSVEARAWRGGVRINVSDTGIGMAAEDIPKALEPFGQIANHLTRRHAGTGLGLPLAKGLVELHGGRLMITSTPGVGTTVTVIFPANVTMARNAAELDESLRRRGIA